MEKTDVVKSAKKEGKLSFWNISAGNWFFAHVDGFVSVILYFWICVLLPLPNILALSQRLRDYSLLFATFFGICHLRIFCPLTHLWHLNSSFKTQVRYSAQKVFLTQMELITSSFVHISHCTSLFVCPWHYTALRGLGVCRFELSCGRCLRLWAGDIQRSSWLPYLDQSNSGHCGHLKSELTDGRFCVCVSIFPSLVTLIFK